jgi:ankyrin repeat protein
VSKKNIGVDDDIDQSRWEIYYEFESIINQSKDSEIIEFLLHKFLPEDFIKIPIVFDLVSYKKVEILDLLYSQNIPLTYQDDYGGTALHVACGAGGNLECVKFFIEKNIFTDINAKSSKFGDTPLTMAICYAHKDIISFFKKKYKITGVSFEDLDVILDRVISNQKRFTGRIDSFPKYSNIYDESK